MSYAINQTGDDSYLADSTAGIGKGLRVKLTNGRKITPCDATDAHIGVTKLAVLDNLTPVPVRLRNAPGTVEVLVNGAFTLGDTLKGDAAGAVAVAGAGDDFATADSSGTDEFGAALPL